MSTNTAKRLILTGPPEEIRKNGIRIGFDIVDLEGNRKRLARSEDCGEICNSQFKVGKYFVMVDEFECLQTEVFDKINKLCNVSVKIVVIDEIGKMEMFSDDFKRNIKNLFNSNCIIIATIPITKGKPIRLVEEIRNDKNSTLFTVNNSNRNTIPTLILDALQKDIIFTKAHHKP